MKLPLRPALRHWSAAVRSAALICLIALAAACGSSNGDDPNPLPDDAACSVLFRDEPESNVFDCSYYSGQVDLEFHAPVGTAYTITVTTGQDWCKTSRNNQTTTKSGVTVATTHYEYLYYEENKSTEARTATVEIRFEGFSTVVLTISQGGGFGSGGGEEEDPDQEVVVNSKKRWAELPVCVETAEAKIVTHFAQIAVDKTVRNYTLRYNTKKRIADWVAYPIHGCYMQGSYSRSDAWQYDPSFPAADQADLSERSYNQNLNPTGIRGHQCMSNHRYCSYSSTLNNQTFYSTNIMPQNSAFNSGLWNKMEVICTNNNCADTLYCVTGNWGIMGYTKDNPKSKDPVEVAVPQYCFKVLLRTVSGKTGKSIDQITDASQLMAIGYYAENSANGNKGNLKDYCVSVAEVERLSGYEFFPMLDESIAAQVKAQCDPAKWGIN